jgi:hypothetical protein
LDWIKAFSGMFAANCTVNPAASPDDSIASGVPQVGFRGARTGKAQFISFINCNSG